MRKGSVDNWRCLKCVTAPQTGCGFQKMRQWSFQTDAIYSKHRETIEKRQITTMSKSIVTQDCN